MVSSLMLFQSKNIKAQDVGQPAMKSVALYSVGGGAAGAALGVAIWLLDPLNPNSDFTNMVLTGFGVGTIGGAVWGALELQKSSIRYDIPEPIRDQGSGFDQNGYLIHPFPSSIAPYRQANRKPIKRPLTLIHYQFRF